MSQLMFSFLGHYFISLKKTTTSFSLFTSSTFDKKGATWRILGAPTILAMAEDKLALNPPKYLNFGNICVLQLVVQVAFANWVTPQPSGEADVGHRHLVLPRTKRALSILRNGYVIFIFSLYTASVCMWRCSINTYCRSPQCPSCRKLLRILSNFLPLATGLPDLSDE